MACAGAAVANAFQSSHALGAALGNAWGQLGYLPRCFIRKRKAKLRRQANPAHQPYWVIGQAVRSHRADHTGSQVLLPTPWIDDLSVQFGKFTI